MTEHQKNTSTTIVQTAAQNYAKEKKIMLEKICIFLIVVIGISATYIFGYDSGYNRGCNNTWDSITDVFCNYGKDSKEKRNRK